MGFRDDFVWGAASSAYQIEGAAREGGKGETLWDVFVREPGRVARGHTGETACDHYHRFREDVALMARLGLKAYRFSLNWARLLPEGTGRVNEEGVRFYSELIDALLEQGIEPWITLFHWELPYALHRQGGWLNPRSPEWFGRFAGLAAQRFGDRVSHFFTLNEPQCFIGLGFLTGEHAPGVRAPLRDTFEMAHNVLKAHGRAVQMLRQYAARPLTIGYAPTCTMCCPATEDSADVEAARQLLFAPNADLHNWAWNVAWWSDPVMLGHYPEEFLRRYHPWLPSISQADLELIAQPIDLYGQNIYHGRTVRMGRDGTPEELPHPPEAPRTDMGWPITPQCLYWGPKFLYERYQTPIVITENGCSCHDVVSPDGAVHDPRRVEFLARYLGALKRAAGEVELRGYFHWAFTDNFEWARGYEERFGLIYIDYPTQQRIAKDSARWYQMLIQTNGADLKEVM